MNSSEDVVSGLAEHPQRILFFLEPVVVVLLEKGHPGLFARLDLLLHLQG